MLTLEEVIGPEAAQRIRSSMPGHGLPYTHADMMRDGMEASSILRRIISKEKPLREELQQAAVDIVYEMFPIFHDNIDSVKVNAKLVDGIGEDNDGGGSDRPIFREELLMEYRKRKLINMMTQGAGIGTHGVHHLKDEFKKEHRELVDDYDRFDELNRKLMRASSEEELPDGGGMSPSNFIGRFSLEHKNGFWVINAEARLFPVLVHEIVKGMYELISMHGLPDNIAVSEYVTEFTDTIPDEIMDCKYGETAYALVRDFVRTNFHDRTDKRPEVFEYYLQHLYEKPAEEMLSCMEAIILGKADMKKVRWTIDDIYKDIERDSHGPIA